MRRSTGFAKCGIRCLFEGLCSGVADGCARAQGKPAAMLLHLGPGLGDAPGSFHNVGMAHTLVASIVLKPPTLDIAITRPQRRVTVSSETSSNGW